MRVLDPRFALTGAYLFACAASGGGEGTPNAERNQPGLGPVPMNPGDDELVTEIEAERAPAPVLEAGRYVRPDDTDTTTPRGLGPAARRVLADYRLVQYDLTVGHRWSEPGLFRDLS